MKILKWIKKHVRPHYKYKSKVGEKINWNDDPENIVDDIKSKSEVGIKFKWKF